MKRFVVIFLVFSIMACKSRKNCKSDKQEIPDISTIALFADTDGWFGLGPHTTTKPIRERDHTSPHGVGRLHRIVVNYSDSNILYAAAPSAGLYKSDNRGRTWSHVFPKKFSSGVFDIEIHPKNPQKLYVVATMMALNQLVYSYGLFVSEDGGKSWNKTGLNFTPKEYGITVLHDCAISTLNPNNIVVCGDNKIYVSNDGAKTFEVKKYPENTKLYFVKSKPNSHTFIVSGNTNFISKNGKDFKKIKGLPNQTNKKLSTKFTRTVFAFGKQKTYAWSSDGGGSFYTSNNGIDWKLLKNRVAYPSFAKLTISIIPNTNENEFLLGSIRLYNFNIKTLKHTMLTTNVINKPNFVHDDARHLFYGLKGTLWQAHDGGLSVSYNNGKTWNDNNGFGLHTMLAFGLTLKNEEKLTIGCGALDMSNIVYIRNQWYCTSNIYGDGGYIGWENKDRLPSYIVRNGELNSFDSASGNYLYMHPPDRKAAYDGPLKYYRLYNELIIGTKKLWLYKNKGWTIVGDFLDNSKIQAFDYLPKNGKAIVSKWEQTWSTSEHKLKGKLWIKNNLNSKEEKWVDLTQNLPILAWRSIADVRINPYNSDEYTVCMAGFDKNTLNKVYQTQDNGITWENISEGLPNLPTNCIRYITYKHKIYRVLGTDDGIYIYNTYTRKWKLLGNNFPKAIVSGIEKHDFSNTLIVATYGRAVWAIRLTDDLMPY